MRTSKKKRVRETIKNILIMILLAMAVILLSFFWSDVSLERLSPLTNDESEESYVPALNSLIKPENMIVNHGDGKFSIITASETYDGESFCEKMDKIISVCMEYADSCTEITEEEYDDMKKYKSVEMKFNYSQDFREYEKLKEIKDGLDNKKIEQFDSIAVGGKNENYLYIKDSLNDLHCKIKIKENAKGITGKRLDNLLECASKLDKDTYTTVKRLVGVSSMAHIQEEEKTDSLTISEKQGQLEFSIADQQNINNIASGFFTSGLDFVRKITENKGSVMYTYGGNQMLIIDEHGGLSYSESLNSSDDTDYDMYHALRTAIEFVAEHGGWDELNENGLVPYLKSAEKVSQGKMNGYKYHFGILLDDIPVEYTKGNAIDITVYGEQVVLYKRNILVLDSDIAASGIAEQSSDESAQHEISESEASVSEYAPIDFLKAKWKEMGEELGYSTYKDFLKGMENIKICYVRDTEAFPLLIKPAWRVEMKDGSKFLYDKATGERCG